MIESYAKKILSAQNGMNIYRGCTHGCIYCDARSKCYQINHDFENIEVKVNAPELLEKELRSKRKRCMIGTGAMCDPYLHIEKQLGQTRRCLELIDEYNFGLAIQTKSARILRDIDLIESINNKTKAVVQMTLTTYDEELCNKIEPYVSTTRERVETLKEFQKRGIHTIVWFTPILPFINDTRENIQGILNYCIEAGVKGILLFGIGLTLRDGNREYFYQKLDEHFPGIKERYIQTFGNAYEIESPHSRELKKMIIETCKKHNIICGVEECFTYMHTFEEKDSCEQLTFNFLSSQNIKK